MNIQSNHACKNQQNLNLIHLLIGRDIVNVKFMNIFNDNDYVSAHSRPPEKQGWKNIISSLLFLLSAPIVALIMISFVFQSYEVFGQSMETTLQNGDRLIVTKVSKNWHKVIGSEYIPSRGEIVVVDRPASLSGVSDNVEHLIKRVIALPGERVVVKNGEIRVYNTDNPDGFNPDLGEEWGRSIIQTTGEVDITVGKGEIFIVGDNRVNSKDSRVFGPVDADLVVGEARLRFAPINNFTSF